MDLELVQAQWKVGFIRHEEAHVIAMQLLEAGVEFPSVVLLAGMIGASSWEVETVVAQIFVEADLPPIDETAARWRLAYETASPGRRPRDHTASRRNRAMAVCD